MPPSATLARRAATGLLLTRARPVSAPVPNVTSSALARPVGTPGAPAVRRAHAARLPDDLPLSFTTTHEVLRPLSVAPDGAVTLTVGLTERAFDLIGDVRRVENPAEPGASVPAGAPLAKLHWEGFRRTASDELYHAVWANAEGIRALSLPFPSTVTRVHREAAEDPYRHVTPGPRGWVVEVSATQSALEAAKRAGAVMGEEAYAKLCESEEEEEDAAASRSYP